MQYTPEQVLQMAPDDASAKAGQQLASNAKWVARHRHELAIWGDCQGSGKTPYRTVVDLASIAFKCTCPSRKFPCKHGLGLMLLYARQPDTFTAENTLPESVAEWLEKRRGKETAAETKPGKQVDEAEKAKRVDARVKKVNAGVEELRFWLRDTVRTGIMNVPQDAYKFNQNIAARMVDAQAGGLAGQLRQLNKIDFYKEGWQRTLTRKLAGIYLLTEAYNNIERLDDPMAREVQSLVGWNVPKEEVLQSPPVTDTWLVTSVTETEEANLTTERTWLLGQASGQMAMVLNFFAGRQVQQQIFVPGMVLKATVHYYPGAQQRRVIVKEQEAGSAVPTTFGGHSSADAVCNLITRHLAVNPFTDMIPWVLESTRIVQHNSAWYIKDAGGEGFELANVPGDGWRMLGLTRGEPATCFGVYENERFTVHALWLNNNFSFVL